MFTTRSQSEMALVGVKSVLSPRPFSAPDSVPTERAREPPGGPARVPRRVASRQHKKRKGSGCEGESEVALSDRSDRSQTADERPRTDSDASQGRPGGNLHHDFLLDPLRHTEDESSVDTAIDLAENFGEERSGAACEEGAPANLRKLVNQTSKDSALGSFTEGITRAVSEEPQAAAPSGDSLRGAEDSPKRSPGPSDSSESEASYMHRTRCGTDGGPRPPPGQGFRRRESRDSSDDGDQPEMRRKPPLRKTRRGRVGRKAAAPQQRRTSSFPADRSVAHAGGPSATASGALAPPAIFTPDAPERLEDPPTAVSRTAQNLQEVIDLRVMEAQRSGHLDLANLGLPFFPSAVLLADGSMIHRVSLQDNGLVEVPSAALTHLSCVTWLDLRYNFLQCLPNEVASLTHLQVLLLQDNHLTALPPALGTLTELTTLQVSDNPLAFPPAEVIRGGAKAILGFLKSRCPTKETKVGSLPAPRGRGGEGSPFAEGATEGGGARGEEPGSGEDEESGRRPEHLREESSGESGSWSDASGQECEAFHSSQQSKQAADACSLPSLASVGQPPHAEAAGGFRIAIKNSDSLEEQETQLHLQVPPQDSGRDTLGRPPSPTSACLLTPNNEFPSRPEYDLPLDGQCHPPHLDGECHDHDDEDSLGWRCECFRSISPVTRDRVRVVSYSKPKSRLAKNTSSDQEPPAENGGGAEPQEQENIFPTGATIAQRRSLHLRLQGDWQAMVEDDLESLEGDIGEGYRRPLSDSDEDEKDKRKGSSETVLTLPVVSLYLPGPDEYRGVLARRYRRSARRQGEAARRARATMLARKGNRDLHKPSRLVTVTEVHKRAREERRRQRERLAALREMTALQRLKSADGLEAWRDEARQMQQHHTLHPDSFLPAVCTAPFAVDGTMLTPRARSKIRARGDQRSSASPTVSDVSGVCAGVRSCLDQLAKSKSPGGSGGAGAGGGAGGGEEGGGTLVNTVSIVHQLSHLRRQLNRLRVNCVI
ncbi:putative serine/threonine-protein kinase roco4-like [Penaeus vannamei]|uniref:Putative serine/threonine-protein kinase roco4-like n=1 Tax=Penaeus vannamei TaxID=6689 RepID=A0A423T8A7_PENVA|nr:putative serine/threonine-protein kinase roco4-like [Penaeus vannamei]